MKSILFPDNNATISAPMPEPKPLTITIFTGSECDSFLVQLFSNPQHMHAKIASKEYIENINEDMSVSDRRILANVIRIMPVQSLPDIFSLKITRAIIDVATISKLFRRDMVSADELLIEIISSMGAIISKTIIAIRYGMSL